jgi:hypothetical protein
MPSAKAVQKDQFAVVDASGLGGARHFSPRNGKIIVAAMVGNAPNARALARCPDSRSQLDVYRPEAKQNSIAGHLALDVA